MIASTLSINQIYLAIYEKTGQPYITENGDVFVYLKEEDAKRFLEENKGSALKGPDYYKVEDLSSICYGAGAEQIIVKVPGRNQERREDLKKMPKKKYYNFPLNRSINLLHETKKKKYLLEMKNEKFIIQVKINSDSDIVIEYSIAKMKDKNYFMAFSNLDEFEKWSEKVKDFNPIEISFTELAELCNEDDCIINVFGARYVLSQEKIKMIREYQEQTDVMPKE